MYFENMQSAITRILPSVYQNPILLKRKNENGSRLKTDSRRMRAFRYLIKLLSTVALGRLMPALV